MVSFAPPHFTRMLEARWCACDDQSRMGVANFLDVHLGASSSSEALVVCWPSSISMRGPAKEVDLLQVVWRQLRQSSISLFSPGVLHFKSVCVPLFIAVAEEVAAEEGPCLPVWIRWIR